MNRGFADDIGFTIHTQGRYSAPELTGGQFGALGEGVQLRPRDLRVDAAAEAAVGGGDDIVPADRFGVPGNAVGDELGVLDDVGGVADHAGQDDLARGQLHVPP